jgi:hypothetical protein
MYWEMVASEFCYELVSAFSRYVIIMHSTRCVLEITDRVT